MDHFVSQDTHFDSNNDAVVSSLLCVLPALLVSRGGNPVQAVLQYCADDLPSPQVFDVGSFRWQMVQRGSRPTQQRNSSLGRM